MQAPSRFERELRAAVAPVARAELITKRGISAHAIKGPDWRQTSRGFYVPASIERDSSSAQRLLEASRLIPREGALTGWAAAYVGGVDALDGHDPRTMRTLPVPLVRGADRGSVGRDWIASCRDALDPIDVTARHGLPITAPARAAFDGMRNAPDLAEAVAFADAMLGFGCLSADALSEYIAGHAGWRGVGRARQALAFANPAARSTWESRLRVEYAMGAQLPAPLVNPAVFGDDGQLLGIPDLLDPKAGLATEFDGQQHREREQHRKDNVREERLEAAGLIVVRIDSRDLLHHRENVRARLRSGWQRGMARDRRRDRWHLGPAP